MGKNDNDNVPLHCYVFYFDNKLSHCKFYCKKTERLKLKAGLLLDTEWRLGEKKKHFVLGRNKTQSKIENNNNGVDVVI